MGREKACICEDDLKKGRCEAEYGRQQGHDPKKAISQFNKMTSSASFLLSCVSPIRYVE